MKIKYITALSVSLLLSVILTVLSVNYQKETIVKCYKQVNCYEEVKSGGFPLQFVENSDINSPAGYANFEDGWELQIFLIDSLIYFLMIFPASLLLTRGKLTSTT